MNSRRLLIGIVITFVLLAILFNFVSFGEVIEKITEISFDNFLIAILIYFLILLSRTIRFWTLLSRKIKMRDFFPIVCLHNFTNVFLPLRTGELGYVYLTKRKGVRLEEGFGSLILARLFDLVSILVIFIFGYSIFQGSNNSVKSFLDIALFVFLIFFSLFFFLLFFRKKFRKIFNFLLKLISLDNNRFIIYFQRKSGEILDYIRDFGFGKKALIIFLESLVIWGLMFYFTYFTLNAFGLGADFDEAIIGSSISLLLGLLPFQGILGLGSTQAAFTIAFVILGFSRDPVILVSFGYHAMTLFLSFLFGVLGFLYRKLLKN